MKRSVCCILIFLELYFLTGCKSADVKKVEKSNDGTHQAGKVIASTPSAGTSAESGSEVYLQVWGAAPTTTSASTTKSSNGFGIDIPRISDIF